MPSFTVSGLNPPFTRSSLLVILHSPLRISCVIVVSSEVPFSNSLICFSNSDNSLCPLSVKSVSVISVVSVVLDTSCSPVSFCCCPQEVNIFPFVSDSSAFTPSKAFCASAGSFSASSGFGSFPLISS